MGFGCVIFVIMLTGCAQQPRIGYRWGLYEKMLLDMYTEPGQAEPSVQVARLSEDVARTEAEGLRVPPGVHAHLGYMYYLVGNQTLAVEQFTIEKAAYPEAALFIDGLLQRAGVSKP